MTQFDVPMSQFLGVAFEQGVHDSAFNSIMELTEKSLEQDGRTLTPKEANELYGLPTLTFDSPVRESEARLLNQRKQSELRRQFYLGQGNPGGLLSGRGIAGLGASMLGSISNPLDFSLNFMPIVGSEAAVAKLASMGRGTFRQSLARGFITQESLALKVPLAPKLTESLIQGFVGNMAAEVPHLMNEISSKGNYTSEEAAINIVAGTAIGGALHLGITSAARIFARASAVTRETMLRRAVDDFVNGRDTRVHQLVSVDENIIRDRVRFDEQVAGDLRFANSLDEARAIVRQEQQEYPAKAAVVNSETGEVRTGPHHWMIYVDDWSEKAMQDLEKNRMMVTNKGRVISMDEAAELGRMKKIEGVDRVVSEQFVQESSDPDYLSPEDRSIFDAMREDGLTDAEAITELRKIFKNRIDDHFFSRPEVQRAVEEEHARVIAEHIEVERQSWDEEGRFRKEYRAEMERQVAEGRTLTPEQAREWGFEDHKSASAVMKQQEQELQKELEALADELGDEAKNLPEGEKFDIEAALEKLKIKGDGLKEGVTGMPVWLWNGAVDAVIAAVKAGRAVKDAIREGVRWMRGNYEFVDRPAIKLRDGRIIRGELGDIHATIKGVPEEFDADAELGFLTSKNRFIDREKAARLMGQEEYARAELASTEQEDAVFEELFGSKISRIDAYAKQFERQAHEALGVRQGRATDMSRRSFINIVSKVTGAMGLTPTSMAREMLEGVVKAPVKQVEKLLLPKLSLNQLTPLLNKYLSLEQSRFAALISSLRELHPQDFEGTVAKAGSFSRQELDKASAKQQAFYPFDLDDWFSQGEVLHLMTLEDSRYNEFLDKRAKMFEKEGMTPSEAKAHVRDFSFDDYVGDTDPVETAFLRQVEMDLRQKPLSELESSGQISKDLTAKLSSLLSEVITIHPDIAEKMRLLMEPEAVKIATKEVDVVAKGTTSAIDAAVNCLTNLKI